MQRARLQLALERLSNDQWKQFEIFASEFLATVYPRLRTVAAPSRDRGRDAEIFSPEGLPTIVFQYSIAKDWASKVRQTAERTSQALPNARTLIYVTNQSILAAIDPIRLELLTAQGLLLDVHDRDWFLDRFASNAYREIAAEHLAEQIVDPYLAGKGVLQHAAPTLTTTESQAALTFLQL